MNECEHYVDRRVASAFTYGQREDFLVQLEATRRWEKSGEMRWVHGDKHAGIPQELSEKIGILAHKSDDLSAPPGSGKSGRGTQNSKTPCHTGSLSQVSSWPSLIKNEG